MGIMGNGIRPRFIILIPPNHKGLSGIFMIKIENLHRCKVHNMDIVSGK